MIPLLVVQSFMFHVFKKQLIFVISPFFPLDAPFSSSVGRDSQVVTVHVMVLELPAHVPSKSQSNKQLRLPAFNVTLAGLVLGTLRITC